MSESPDKLTCFADGDRFCGPDCMAYKTIPDENQQLDSGQQHCVLLSSIERTGRSLNIIGSVLNAISSRMKKREEDAMRGTPPAPPNPLGGIR